jgi:pSer/pThr/pTyr-binding forkhead associated (FHA) protein
MDEFLQSCGIGPFEVSVSRMDGATIGRYPFSQPWLLCGRADDNHLLLSDQAVSLRHAYFQGTAGRIFCQDLGSRTGLHWPKGRQPSGWLHWDEPLRIGHTILRFHRLDQTTALAKPSDVNAEVTAPLGPHAPRILLEYCESDGRVIRWRMNWPISLVGKAKACKLCLWDGRVSHCHCSLVAGSSGIWVVDLGSQRGTLVNGVATDYRRLAHGDQLQVGPFTLHVAFEADCNGGAELPRALLPMLHGLPKQNPPDPTGRLVAALAYPAARSTARPMLAGMLEAGAPPLLSLLDQFSAMQQHMFDQFHRSMLVMAETVMAVQQGQLCSVREELAELRRVTEELRSLQADQARRILAGANGSPAASKESAESAGSADAVPHTTAAPPIAPSEYAASAPEPSTAAATGPTSQAPSARTAPGPAAALPVAGPEIHEWLNGRIASLEEERQARWRKVLSLFTGA